MKIHVNNIEVLVEDHDRYLQVNDIGEAALRELWPRLEAGYATYDKWLCFRNVDVPIAFLNTVGAALEDDCIQARLYADKLIKFDISTVERITDNTFNEFAAVHDARITDMYWTSERLGRDLSKWGIFCLRADGAISGYTIMSMRDPHEAEIFCMEAFDMAAMQKLFAATAGYAFDNGKTEVLYMADTPLTHDAALSVGFAVTGFYKGYKIKGEYPCWKPLIKQ